jgi:hypothetical protein
LTELTWLANPSDLPATTTASPQTFINRVFTSTALNAHTLHLSREVPIYGLSERLRMLSVAVFGSLRLAQFRPAVEHEHRECEIDSALIFRIGGIEDSGESRCTIKTAPKSYDKLP